MDEKSFALRYVTAYIAVTFTVQEAVYAFRQFQEAVSKATGDFIRLDSAQAIQSYNDLRSFRRQLRLRRDRKNWRGWLRIER